MLACLFSSLPEGSVTEAVADAANTPDWFPLPSSLLHPHFNFQLSYSPTFVITTFTLFCISKCSPALATTVNILNFLKLVKDFSYRRGQKIGVHGMP